MLTANFRFNKAGQGCFYTGWFNKGDKNYTMVYDCGTKSPGWHLRNEVLNFKSELLLRNNNKLNLLIISHFDKDHISHISLLLKDLESCDKVILPYLNPSERLTLYYNNLSGVSGINQDYRNFMTDPVTYLLNLNPNIEKIIFYRSELGEEDNVFKNETDNPEPPSFSENDLIGDIQNNVLPISNVEYEKNPKVLTYKHKTHFFISSIWDFYFYNNLNLNNSLISNFITQIKLTYPKLIKGAKINIEDLHNIFKTKGIKNIYINIFGKDKMNLTSLLVYHKPVVSHKFSNGEIVIFDKRIYQSRFYYDELYPLIFKNIKDSQNSTLLTGDTNLNTCGFNKNIPKDILFLQIPHHGSEKSWTFKNNQFKNLTNINAIINFGLGNIHKHPSARVLDNIKRNFNWKINLNHQLKSFNYCYFFN